ncbi:protein-glutamate O-methyltransferase CheR [Endozoicomonas sp. SM1973]|uniref:protein-glutamate O-methyltransferase n=1 Tax=Spartinivicinus marinus TaxID=2994442 RepID=A0A853I8P0_9GAMM|nr:protein-glutamate O-methyltransferase CheR [Spartinivicinus marinus]
MTQSGLSSKVALSDFDIFSQFLEKACGIVLGKNKEYLVKSRLRKILNDNKIDTLAELVKTIERNPRDVLRGKVIDAMTTNETLWFRDNYPFEVFKNTILPELCKRYPNQRLRVWSAACSSGQEPYSISMATDEFERTSLGQLKAGLQIIATDLSNKVLAECRTGEYDSLALGRGLSDERLKRYFNELQGKRWEVKPEIKKRIEFKELNLQESYASLGKFDVVFCRNVLIYFSADFKRDILSRIHKTLKPGGYLFLGASEALNGLADLYEMVQCRPGIMYVSKGEDVFARSSTKSSTFGSSTASAKTSSTTSRSTAATSPTTRPSTSRSGVSSKTTSSTKSQPSTFKPKPKPTDR